MTENNELVLIVNQAGLAQDQSKQLLASFSKYFQEAKSKSDLAKEIKVDDVRQVEEMKKARETRLELKSIRVNVERTRKQLKEQIVIEGKAIDGIANVIKALIVPVEQYLENQEKFAERLEAERKNKIEATRISKLLQYVEEAESYSLHPDQMSEETFNKLLDNSRLAFEARKKAEEEAEKARLEQIKAEKIEQERIRKENIKLKKEAEEKEKEREKERAELQKKLEAERKAKEIVEQKAREEKESREAKERAEKAKLLAEQQAKDEAERKALLAPDKIKLLEFAKQLQAVVTPAVKSKEADIILETVMKNIDNAINILQSGAKKL